MPFKKGASGNPGGRPKEIGHIRELARAHTSVALDTLVGALGDKNRRTAVAAAEVLLDRGWGKATQHIEAEVNILDRLKPHERDILENALEKSLGITGGSETRPAGNPSGRPH